MRDHHRGDTCRILFLSSLLLAACALDPAEDEELIEDTTFSAITGCSELSVASVAAIGHDGNLPANTLDGSFATRWSHFGEGSWITYDLGQATSVNGVSIAWFVGTSRVNSFTVSVSADNATFTQVKSSQSSGTTTSYELTLLSAPVSARYVRITVNGNTSNDWASITEARVCGDAGSSALPYPSQPIPATPVDTTLRTVAQWESLFLNTWNTEHTNTYWPYATSKNSWRFYNLAYAIDGLTSMFEATGKTQYLDRALQYVEAVVNSAVLSSSLPNSQYKDGYLGWGAWNHPTDPSINGGEYPLFESYCFRYAGKLLRAMRDRPAIYGSSTYRAKYDRILTFMKQNIWAKWVARGANSHVYRVNTHMTSHWAFISIDLWALTSDPTERAKYRAVVDNINLDLPNYTSSLRQQMRPHPSDSAAYFWNSNWGQYSTPGQDVSHGNAVISYIVEAHRLGVEWTATDIQKLTRTLRYRVWKSGGGYAAYVDGSGTGNGWINDGFVKLGRFSIGVQKSLEQYTIGRGMQLYGNGALNALILNGR